MPAEKYLARSQKKQTYTNTSTMSQNKEALESMETMVGNNPSGHIAGITKYWSNMVMQYLIYQ